MSALRFLTPSALSLPPTIHPYWSDSSLLVPTVPPFSSWDLLRAELGNCVPVILCLSTRIGNTFYSAHQLPHLPGVPWVFPSWFASALCFAQVLPGMVPFHPAVRRCFVKSHQPLLHRGRRSHRQLCPGIYNCLLQLQAGLWACTLIDCQLFGSSLTQTALRPL